MMFKVRKLWSEIVFSFTGDVEQLDMAQDQLDVFGFIRRNR